MGPPFFWVGSIQLHACTAFHLDGRFNPAHSSHATHDRPVRGSRGPRCSEQVGQMSSRRPVRRRSQSHALGPSTCSHRTAVMFKYSLSNSGEATGPPSSERRRRISDVALSHKGLPLWSSRRSCTAWFTFRNAMMLCRSHGHGKVLLGVCLPSLATRAASYSKPRKPKAQST